LLGIDFLETEIFSENSSFFQKIKKLLICEKLFLLLVFIKKGEILLVFNGISTIDKQ
jgi:hypothetical protein